MTLIPQPEISREVLDAVSDTREGPIRDYIRRLVRSSKNNNSQSLSFLKQTMTSLANMLKDPNIHPKIKLQTHRIIMFLILMADLDVYEEFLQTLYPIIRANCMYNKGVPVETRGDDFFKKCKYFIDPSATTVQKAEIKNIGASYIIFCLETVFMLAKWLPYDLQDDTKPTKFSIAYQSLRKQGVEFPKEQNFKYYTSRNVEQIERIIREIEKEYQSILGSQAKNSSAGEFKMQPNQLPLSTHLMKPKESHARKDNVSLHKQTSMNMDMQGKNKIFLLQDEKNKLLKEIQIQRNFFEGELEKQRKMHQDNIYKYEKKIQKLEQEIEILRQKLASSQSRPPTLKNSQLKTSLQTLQPDRAKDKLIDELQNTNKQLTFRIKKLQDDIKNHEVQYAQGKVGSQVSGLQGSQSVSVMSVEIEKLKKENKSLKAKILTECSQASEFSTKKSDKTRNSQKQPHSLKFLGYEEGRSSFQPFYSNSSSQIKIRLRKAILRQKQLLYRDKTLQIGCITKLQGQNTIRMTTVFTNVSQKPLFNFAIDFVSREDLVVKLIQNTKNYLQISGQTKSQVLVSINQIDFRCLLCSVRFNIQEQVQKVALIMPISKLKLAQQLVYTPIKKQQKMKKIEKVFQCDRKMLPNLHKFKDYFDQAILEVDRTLHQTYNLKIQFINSKFYVECDQIEGELRLAVKYYEDEEYARAQKLLQQLVFLLIKNT